MAPSRKELDIAVAAYWQAIDDQRTAAEAIGSTAEGSSVAVRGGGHFNPVANLIARFFTDAGYPPESIHAGGAGIRLPGYYRPTKDWDLVVKHQGVLVAAIELKALGGPSFGNNYNNRVEEAVGTASDIEAWVPVEAWHQALELMHQAALLLHAQAQPSGTPDTVHVSATVSAFTMAGGLTGEAVRWQR